MKTDMQIIKEAYDSIADFEPVFSRLAIQNIIECIRADFFSIMKTITLKELPRNYKPLDGETKDSEEKIIELMKDKIGRAHV